MENKENQEFTSISSYFSQATLKFTENHQFAYLCSILIENSKSLITDSHNNFIFDNFDRDSDIITLLNTIYEYSKYEELDNCNCGLSIANITSIYANISRNFGSCDGQKAVIDAIRWSKNQIGGTLAMVDKFVGFLLEQKEFKEKRRYTFVRALNANFDNRPNIIFKSIDDSDTIITINNRPGWRGLEIPGNIIILNDYYLIHRDHTNQIENPGIVGLEINNPSVNSIFFLPLLESYLYGQDIDKDFTKIYRSPKPAKETAYIFHISNDNGQTILNFCPRSNSIEKIFSRIFPKLLALMPFLPCSIIFNIESLGSAIEVKNYGNSIKYIQKVLPYSEPDQNLPFAYPLCRETLEFASHNIEELEGPNSTVRFAITGENLLYNQNQTNKDDKKLPTTPDAAMESNFVFDKKHPSHLVLLVDKKCCDQPRTKPLTWTTQPSQESSENKESSNINMNDNSNINGNNNNNENININDNSNINGNNNNKESSNININNNNNVIGNNNESCNINMNDDNNINGNGAAAVSSSLFYIPVSKDEKLIQLNQLVKDKENDSTCIYTCSPPKEYLTHPLFIYQGYNKSKAVSMCKSCQISLFQSLSELTKLIDPITHKINESQFHKMYKQMSGISLNIKNGSNVPLGQIIWPLINDTELFDNYVKSYFTLFVEYAIRSSRNYFTFCPHHPSLIQKVSKQKICCTFCDLVYCYKCRNWHKIDQPCDHDQIIDGIKLCPRCFRPISNIPGSSVLTCTCGAIFCFKCGDKSPVFNSSEEAYEHVYEFHIKKET